MTAEAPSSSPGTGILSRLVHRRAGESLTPAPDTRAYAAVQIGTGGLSADVDGQPWSGSFTAAHAWSGGEATGTNPAGTGSAV